MSEERDKDRTEPGLPAFDPNPSARFASELLREAGVPFALIGRVAMWTVLPAQEHQFTKDVDFAVPRSAGPAIAAALAERHIAARPLAIGGLGVRTEEVRVDFIDRREGGLDALYAEPIDEAARRPGIRIGRAVIPVAPAEYLVALKVVSADRKDLRDAIQLIRSAPRLELPRARDIGVRRGGPVDANLFDALAREAGHPDARPAFRNGGSE